jgi:hypothetical protein
MIPKIGSDASWPAVPQGVHRKIDAIALLEQSKILKIFRKSSRRGRSTSESYAIENASRDNRPPGCFKGVGWEQHKQLVIHPNLGDLAAAQTG